MGPATGDGYHSIPSSPGQVQGDRILLRCRLGLSRGTSLDRLGLVAEAGFGRTGGAFDELEDPRRRQGQRHRLADVILIAVAAVICGADSWVEVELFGRAKERWLREFLELPNGIPSHDTFGRVFAALDPAKFEACFRRWVAAVNQTSAGQVVAIDGKTLRRSHDRGRGRGALHMVSAWAAENGLALGQLAVEAKSNEITAIPELLKVLLLAGTVVTIDAIGCQDEIAEQIVAEGGDYVLAVKDNQPKLHREVQWLFNRVGHPDYTDLLHDEYRSTEKDHGRLETRVVQTITAPSRLESLDAQHRWAGLRSVAAVHATRQVDGQTSHQTRYFISSLAGDAQELSAAIRSHWTIENALHWSLDVAFREDESRVRVGDAAENLAVLRRIALNVVKKDRTQRCGLKAKRLKAGWDEGYLEQLLAQA